MGYRRLWFVAIAITLLISFNGCAVPQKMWPQKDLARSTISGAADAPRILLASRSSEFKAALVEKLRGLMASEGMRLDITGIEDLAEIDSSRYDAVVVISTCLAWGFDDKVRSFIESRARHDETIFVTTSASGDWMPDQEGLGYDAISSASELADVDSVARNILSSVNAIVRRVNP